MYDIRSGYLQDAAIHSALYTRKDDEVVPVPPLVVRTIHPPLGERIFLSSRSALDTFISGIGPLANGARGDRPFTVNQSLGRTSICNRSFWT